ncbi:MAG: DUF1819 family protein [Vulcanimicrobiota bacterium]
MQQHYSAKLTGNQFLFSETRTVAALKLEGLTDAQIKPRVIDDNMFRYKTAKSIIKRLNEVFRRLRLLDDDLLKLLACGSSDSARLVNFYMIVKSDRLFLEFINEVMLERILMKTQSLTTLEVRSFLNHKAEQSEKVARWTDNTKENLISAYLTILRQSGFLHGGRNSILSPPVISLELEDHFKEKGEKFFLKIFTGALR